MGPNALMEALNYDPEQPIYCFSPPFLALDLDDFVSSVTTLVPGSAHSKTATTQCGNELAKLPLTHLYIGSQSEAIIRSRSTSSQ